MTRTRARMCLGLIGILAVMTPQWHADAASLLSQVAALRPHPDGVPGDPFARFGGVLALDGDTAVVAAALDDSAGSDAGAAYVFGFVNGAWVLQHKLVSPDPQHSEGFGDSLALSGTTLAVGASGRSSAGAQQVGAVYVFVRDGASWSLQQMLTAHDGGTDDRFGASVALHGNTLAVGAPDFADTGRGAAYVFTRAGTTWTRQQKLQASDGQDHDVFGAALALDVDTLAVGAPLHQSTGATYVFERAAGVWSQAQKLTSSTASSQDRLGSALALAGDTLLVSAPEDGGTGAVFSFVRGSGAWSETQRLVPSVITGVQGFGSALALWQDTALIGAPRADVLAIDAGAAYVFARAAGTWSEHQRLLAAEGLAEHDAGRAVALSGTRALVGAPYAGPLGVYGGAADAWQPRGGTWTRAQTLLGQENAGADALARALALDGDTLAAGAPHDDTAIDPDSGAALVFTRQPTGFVEQAKLTAADGERFDLFGQAVALDGDTLAVSAPRANTPTAPDVGAVYVFRRVGQAWSLEQKIVSPADSYPDFFGAALALDGDTLAVGSPGDDSPAAGAGRVDVFVRSGATWSLQQQLFEPGGAAQERFGAALALRAERLAVGAPGSGATGLGRGFARLFERAAGVWSAGARLVASDGSAGDAFGQALALDDATLVVGAPLRDLPGAVDAGAAYVFTRAGAIWTEQQRLLAPGAPQSARFGAGVALDADLLAVGAPAADGSAAQPTGAAFTFVRAGATWLPLARSVARDGRAGDEFGAAVALSGARLASGASEAGAGGSAYVFEDVRKGDFGRDLQTDLLLRNEPGAFHEAWLMNGVVRSAATRVVPDLPDAAWQVAGVDDFDADGRNDLVLWNSVTGAVEFWLMDGTTRPGAPVPLSHAPTLAVDWRLAATGDFNADGNPDLVWRNVASQKIVLWTLRGTARLGALVPTPDQAAAANWEIVAALDWNGDGTRDLLWYNRDSGKLVQWLMDASVVRQSGRFTTPAGAGNANWRVLAAGDYGAGPGGVPDTHDVVWRNAASGRLVVWHLDLQGTRSAGVFTTPDAPTPNPLEWTVAGPR